MCFTVTKVSWRRSDQLGDLMTMLELSTVNLDHRAGILDQGLCRRFHGPRFTRSRGAEKEKVSNGPAGSVHAGDIHLINVDNLPNCCLLSDDSFAQVRLKL